MDYQKQAIDFLEKHGLDFSATLVSSDPPPWGDQCPHGDKYQIRIFRTKLSNEDLIVGRPRSITFNFWNSFNDMREGKRPTPYNVLACISGGQHCLEDFQEFCLEAGYEISQVNEALAIWKRCLKLSKRLKKFFTEQEQEDLEEIQ